MKRILLAEDDADDQEILKEVLGNINSDIDLTMVDNGEQLIRLLDKLPETALPDLIILDQNMPRLKGNETLLYLREQERYKRIPSVIYSTYHDSKFTEGCQALKIDLLLKPDTFEGFTELVLGLLKKYSIIGEESLRGDG